MSAAHVQHVGSCLLLAMVAAEGLHAEAAALRGEGGFVLVPSGMFDMGLSDAELDHLRTLAEPHRDTPPFDAA